MVIADVQYYRVKILTQQSIFTNLNIQPSPRPPLDRDMTHQPSMCDEQQSPNANGKLTDKHQATEQQSICSEHDAIDSTQPSLASEPTDDFHTANLLPAAQQEHAQTSTHHCIIDDKRQSNLQRVGSGNSISSMASISSFNSSHTNQHHEICENLETEVRSTTRSVSHSNDDRLILPLLAPNSNNNNNSIHSNNHNTPWPIPPSLVITGSTPSPTASHRHNNNGNDNGNDNDNDDELVIMQHLISPHISALSKLHTNNLSHRELSISPNQLEHQDIKDKRLQNDESVLHEQNEHDHTKATNGNDSHESRSSISTLSNALWSSLQTVNSFIPYTSSSSATQQQHNVDDGTLTDNDCDHEQEDEHYHDEDEKKEEVGHSQPNDQQQQLYNESTLHSIINTPKFMSNAIAMYGELDHALQNINDLKQRQLQQLKSLQLRRRKKRSNEQSAAALNNEDNIEDQEFEELDVNERVVDVMKTLISSTTEMGSFFTTAGHGEYAPDANETDDGSSHTNDEEPTSRSTSLIGRLLGKLSSSIAYMSYISVSTVTPFIYNMVEAVLVELYSTIKDIIEFYDPDPKNNILWRIIHKMDEIMQAIRGLLALSDCFYEISSDHDDDDAHNGHSYSFFTQMTDKKKEKED